MLLYYGNLLYLSLCKNDTGMSSVLKYLNEFNVLFFILIYIKNQNLFNYIALYLFPLSKQLIKRCLFKI